MSCDRRNLERTGCLRRNQKFPYPKELKHAKSRLYHSLRLNEMPLTSGRLMCVALGKSSLSLAAKDGGFS